MKSMRDNTWRFQVDTQELAPEDITAITSELHKLGYFFFQNTPIKEVDMSKLPPIDLAKKSHTKSQLLRYALFRAWEQTGAIPEDRPKPFDEFYDEHMDKITEYVTNKYLTQPT